jgi:predicted alpha/beta hydrolase
LRTWVFSQGVGRVMLGAGGAMPTDPGLVHDLELRARDGRTLAATVFEPAGPARATVLVLGAWAVPRRYYQRFGAWLAARGHRVMTFDPRAIGDSVDGPVRQETITTSGWARLDYAAALDWLASQPGPRLGVAHSFGGQVPGIIDEAAQLDGLYSVGSQLGWWGYFDGLARARMMGVTRLLLPTLAGGLGYLPKWAMGEAVPGPAVLEWTRWMRTSRYLLDHVQGAEARYRDFPAPHEMLGFTDDDYAPPAGVAALAACFSAERTRLRILRPEDVGMQEVGHFGFFRPHEGDTMWRDCAERLDTWAAAEAEPPAPSTAETPTAEPPSAGAYSTAR